MNTPHPQFNDPWATALAGAPTPWQANTISQHFATLGITDTTERRTIASRIIGRLVSGFSELNGDEAQRLIEALDQRMSTLRVGIYQPKSDAELALTSRMNSRFD